MVGFKDETGKIATAQRWMQTSMLFCLQIGHEQLGCRGAYQADCGPS